VEAAAGDDFNSIFIDFTRALIMSGTGDSEESRYAFTSLNLRTIQSQGRADFLSAIPVQPEKRSQTAYIRIP
jgi:hypothetical protein